MNAMLSSLIKSPTSALHHGLGAWGFKYSMAKLSNWLIKVIVLYLIFCYFLQFPSKQLGQMTCPSQIFWGAQTYSDRERFGPTIAAVDELGIRENTYVNTTVAYRLLLECV